MNDRQIKQGALKLLRKARAWFKSKDRLVKDWAHMFEDRHGNKLLSPSRDVCRTCMLGAIPQMTGARLSAPLTPQYMAHRVIVGRASYEYFLKPYSLAAVQNRYDRAIAKLERELAKE